MKVAFRTDLPDAGFTGRLKVAKTEQHPQGIKTIRLSQRELAAVLEEIESLGGGEAVAQLRCEPRVPLADAAPMLIRVSHPGGSTVELVVKARNLSSMGIGFIIGSFLYAGTTVTVYLARRDGQPQAVPGRVVRCVHIRGLVHDVGVRFDKAIDLSQIVESHEDGDVQMRKAENLPQFDGNLLYIDPSPDDRDLMSFVLGRLGLVVDLAGSAEAGLEMAAKRLYDGILVDLRTRDIDAKTLPEILRKRNYPGPIVAVSVTDSPEDEAAAIDVGYSYLLSKPLRQDSTVRLAERYLRRRLRGGDAENVKPMLSQFWSDVEMRPLILRFLGRLEQNVGKMTRFLAEKNLCALEQTCGDLVSAAAGYGFPQVAELVESVKMLCNLKSPMDQITRTVEELVKLCDAAMGVRRAAESK